ncbi:MAG: DUF3857 domain-containing protein [Candidatus Glassbacteria bacterium]|nr:DUF3857 domain-containing protein [Candidatus Glassbacteria bacterium]
MNLQRIIHYAAGAVALLVGLPLNDLNAEVRLDEAEIARIVADAPGLNDYPAAGALILYQGKSLVVLPDGTNELTEHLLVKILQDRGRGFGDQKRNFDSETDSVAILLARTWLPDGGTVPVEDKAINVITPPELTGAAVYADIKQKVISFGGIQPGAVVELVTRTISAPDSADKAGKMLYWDREMFRTFEPILRKRYELLVPADAPEPLVVRRNGLGKAEVQTLDLAGNEFRQYGWELADVPMIQRIPYMPPSQSYSPWLLVSNVDSWENLGRWLAARFFPSVETGGALRQRADSLVAGSASLADSVRAIALYVATEVRNIGLALPLTAYQPTPAGKVLENMYGHGLDKAVLLVSMLRAAGIEAWPAYGSGEMRDMLEEDVPAAAQFDRVMVFVAGYFTDSTFVNPLYGETGRHGLWLHPTAQYNRYGYHSRGQGSRALVLLESGGTLHRLRSFPPEKSLSLVRAELVLADNGDVTGAFHAGTDGLFDIQARLSLKDDTPRERQQYFSQAANAISEGARATGVELSDLRDLTVPASLDFEYSAPGLGVVQGEMMILRLPAPPFGFTGLPYFPDLETREYEFVGDGPFTLVREYTITLPEGWKVAYMPEHEALDCQYGRWLVDCTRSGRSLNLRRSLTVSARTVGTDGYPEFRQFFQGFTLPRQTLILLERGSTPGS